MTQGFSIPASTEKRAPNLDYFLRSIIKLLTVMPVTKEQKNENAE